MTKAKKKERQIPTRYEIRMVLRAARNQGKINNRRIDAVASLLWEAWKLANHPPGQENKASVQVYDELISKCLYCGAEAFDGPGGQSIIHEPNCQHIQKSMAKTVTAAEDSDLPVAVVSEHMHLGEGGNWCFWSADYPGDGTVGPFLSREKAIAEAKKQGYGRCVNEKGEVLDAENAA